MSDSDFKRIVTFALIQNYSDVEFHYQLLVSSSGHVKESVGNLWSSLRPVCELQGKVTGCNCATKKNHTGKRVYPYELACRDRVKRYLNNLTSCGK